MLNVQCSPIFSFLASLPTLIPSARSWFARGKRDQFVKKIEAVVRHFKLDEIAVRLDNAGFQGMTVSEVRGYGRQKGHSEAYRGAEYQVDFVPKLKIEVIVRDEDAQRVMSIIADAARTGSIGDGKIFVSDLCQVMRIRTSELGAAAV
jgi:nitrogen regulatory protein P-II 1